MHVNIQNNLAVNHFQAPQKLQSGVSIIQLYWKVILITYLAPIVPTFPGAPHVSMYYVYSALPTCELLSH